MTHFLPEPDELATPGVAAAWRKACGVRGKPGGDILVGIVKDDRLIARGALATYEQLVAFSLQMTRLGYRAVGGEAPHAPRCDVLFSVSAEGD